MNNKARIYIFLFLLLMPFLSFAKITDLTISPLVIEADGEAGELLKFDLNIQNNEDFKAVIYPIVEDFYSKKSDDAVDGGIEGSVSPSEWIKIQRSAIRIESGQNKDIGLKLDISNNATPGTYSAKIFFTSARNRATAEEKAKNFNEPEIVVNISVADNIVKDAEISNFQSDKLLFLKSPVELSFDFKNIGNRAISPVGDLSVYNNRNQEIASIVLDGELDKVLTNESRKISLSLPNINGFGKYKAKVRLTYNDKTKNIQDVVYFTYLPWKKVLILAILFLIILIFISIRIFKGQKNRADNLVVNEQKTIEHTVNLRKK